MTDEPSSPDAGDPSRPPPDDPVGRLLRLFDLERIGEDRFAMHNPDPRHAERVFGGQVAAQALRAAAHTVEVDHPPHSLHAYFIRPGKPGVPIVYEVERTRDGRSFTTRRVLAVQDDEPIFETSVSFHRAESGVDYQQPMPADVAAPEDAPTMIGIMRDELRAYLPMEIVELAPTPPGPDGYVQATRRAWMRLKRTIDASDPVLHRCILAFLSDMGAMVGACAPVPELRLDRLMGASLDHAVWFHRPMRADEWFLYELRSVSNAGSRGLAVGTMHSRSGVLGASVAQEALLRVVDR